MRKDYVKISYNEFKGILFISAILGVMFALTFVRFASGEVSLVENFMVFFVFMVVLLSLRILFMKFVAYRNAFEIEMRVDLF